MNTATRYSRMVLTAGLGVALAAVTGACLDHQSVSCGQSACLAGYTCERIGDMDMCIPAGTPLGVCGNGLAEDGEQCDEGDVIAGDGCGPTCQLERCGNAIVDPGEECDCGEGVASTEEICRNLPNSNAGGHCKLDCTMHCGDGLVAANETCDRNAVALHCTDFGFDLGQLQCNDTCTGQVFDDCRHLNWNLVTPPSVTDLRGMWGTGPDDIFVVGNDNFIAHYNGSEWVTMSVPISVDIDLYDVWGASSDDVYAVGWREFSDIAMVWTEARVFHYDGQSWTESLDLFNYKPTGVWGSGEGDVFVANGYGVSHFDGSAWTLSSYSGGRINAVWGSGPDDVYAVGDAGAIGHYTNGQWNQLAGLVTANLNSVWGSGTDDVFAVGDNGTIIHFDGNAWQLMVSPTTHALTRVWGANADHVFAVGENGESIYYNRNDGGSGDYWVSLPFADSQNIHGIWGTGPDEVTIVGDAGLMARYTGNALLPLETSVPASLYDVWGSGSNDVFAVGDGLSIIHYDGGHQFDDMQSYSPGYISITGITGFSDTNVLATGYGRMYAYNGTNWTQSSVSLADCSAIHRSTDLWAASPSEIFLVGTRTDGYEKCDPVPPGEPPDCYCTEDHFSGVSRSSILQYRDGTWSEMEFSVTDVDTYLRDIWGSASNDIFTVGDDGIIKHYDGAMWTDMQSPSLATLTGVWGSGPDDVFAVGRDSVLLHYDGSAWTTMDWTGTLLNFVAISGRDGNDVYAAGVGALGQSTLARFDGIRWYPIVDPAIADMSIRSLWVAPDGTVFVVGDAGKVVKLILR